MWSARSKLWKSWSVCVSAVLPRRRYWWRTGKSSKAMQETVFPLPIWKSQGREVKRRTEVVYPNFRFLWRNLEIVGESDIYEFERMMFGDRLLAKMPEREHKRSLSRSFWAWLPMLGTILMVQPTKQLDDEMNTWILCIWTTDWNNFSANDPDYCASKDNPFQYQPWLTRQMSPMGQGFKMNAVNVLKAVISPMVPMRTPRLVLMAANFTLQLTLPDPCCSEHSFVSRFSLLPFPLGAHREEERTEPGNGDAPYISIAYIACCSESTNVTVGFLKKASSIVWDRF